MRYLLQVIFLLGLVIPGALFAQETHWAFQISGTSLAKVSDVAVSKNGDIAAIGYFYGDIDLDPGSAVVGSVSVGSNDVFVGKYNSEGDLLWGFTLGGSSLEEGNSVAMDDSGSVYIVGRYTDSIDFDPGTGEAWMAPTYSSAGFIAKYDSNGNYVWSHTTTGGSLENGSHVVIDSDGNVIWTGEFQNNCDFDPSQDTFNLTSSSGRALFIAKYTPGGGLIDAVYAGGAGTGVADFWDVTTDQQGSIYLGGYWSGTMDFDPSSPTVTSTSMGTDAFLLKLDSNLDYALHFVLSSPEFERIQGVNVDLNGNILLTGAFRDTLDFDVTAGVNNVVTTTPFGSGSDIFLAQYDASMNLNWVHHFGYNAPGSWSMGGQRLQTDANNDIVVVGDFEGNVDFDPGQGTVMLSGSNTDIFIARYDQNGDFKYAWKTGGSGLDVARALAIDPSGDVVAGGVFNGNQNFQMDTGSLFLSAVASDGFVMRHYHFCDSSNIDAGPDKVICWGDSINLGASSVSNYYWDGFGIMDSLTVSPDSTTSYVVQGLEAQGCVGRDTVVVQVIQPMADALDTANMCLGSSVTLSATGGVTYTWNQGLGTGQMQVVSPDSSQRYSVTVTDINGCVDTASTWVEVLPVPMANAGPNDSICLGDTAYLVASGGANYQWSHGLGNAANVAAVPSSSTTYGVVVTDSNNCSALDSVHIEVRLLPVVSTSNDTTICVNDTALVSASGGSTYVWNNGIGSGAAHTLTPQQTQYFSVTVTDVNGCESTDSVLITVMPLPSLVVTPDTGICGSGTVSISAAGANDYFWSQGLGNGAIHSVSPTTLTTYVVTATSSFGCVSVDSVVVDLWPLPAATTNNDTSICLGDSITLAALGGSTYQWNNGLGTGSLHQVSPAANTIYSVTVTDANGCTDNENVEVDVFVLPIANAGADTSICLGDTAAMSAAGGVAYEWSGGLGSTQTVMVSPADTMTYAVTVTDGNNCSSSDSVTVFIVPLPNGSAGADQAICDGATTVIEATGGVLYQWSQGLGNGAQHTVSPTTSSTYVVTVYNAFDCFVVDTMNIVVNPTPQADFTGLEQGIYCLGADTVVLSGIPSGGAFMGNGIVGNSFVPFNAGVGMHVISYAFTDTNGCTDTAQYPAEVTEGTQPMALFSYVVLYSEVNFQNQSTNGNTSFWSFGDGDTSLATAPTHDYDSSGTFMACLTERGSCALTDTFCDNIVIDLVGVEGMAAHPSFTVYPNPNNGSFQLTIGQSGTLAGELQLYNAVGQLVHSWFIDNGGSHTINTSKVLPAGSYFLILHTEHRMLKAKMIVR